jgi:hypothetical protein
MTFARTPIALAAFAACTALPAAAQTSTTTIEAESMTLSSYQIENGTRIRLTASSGTATKSFSGASGTYMMQVYVHAEDDGRSTLEVYKGATLLRKYTYPLSKTATSFTIDNVALKSGETIKLLGRRDAGAVARVDKIVLKRVATSSSQTTQPATTTSTTQPVTTTSTTQPVSTTPIIGNALASVSPITMEAEGMALSAYAVENGKRIMLTASSGTATKNFNGAKGTYKVQVYVHAEDDGQSTLEVYKGATLLRKYTYPLSKTTASFTIDNVALNSGEPIKLLGRKDAGAVARVDKIVFTPVGTTTPTTDPVTSTPEPTPATAACANPSGGYEGFGRNTTGGAGKPVYRVTNLNDSGSGSLRDALSQGNRCVVFDVGGTISLSGNLLVKGANVTIDGFTAPSPGITLRNRTLVIQGTSGAGNVVVRGIRHRGAPAGIDAIRVYKASNAVFDRVSVSGFGDGALDVTENSRDVTIQWSILGAGNPDHNMVNLIGYDTSRISAHHNLYINGGGRHPYCGRNGSASLPAEVVCDVRNNLVWNYTWTGTSIRAYGTANVVNNYYYTAAASNGNNTIYLAEGGSAYVSGNYSKNGWNLATGDRATPFAAVEPATTDAVTAAKEVLAKAGARGPKFGLDSADQSFIGQVSVD